MSHIKTRRRATNRNLWGRWSRCGAARARCHIAMRHVTNESRHKRVKSQMSHVTDESRHRWVTSQMSHVTNESRHKWVTSHIKIRHVTGESCHIYEYLAWHIEMRGLWSKCGAARARFRTAMSQITNESRHKWVTSDVKRSRVTNTSYYTEEWVTRET